MPCSLKPELGLNCLEPVSLSARCAAMAAVMLSLASLSGSFRPPCSMPVAFLSPLAFDPPALAQSCLAGQF